MSTDDQKARRTRAERVRATMRRCGPDLLARLESGTPLALALVALQLSPELEGDLATRRDVRAALARRCEALRAQLADPDKAKREAAQYLLEVDFGVRRPGTASLGARLAGHMNRFRDWCVANDRADAFNQWRNILVDAGEAK